jgi:hypothetical protein
MLWPESPATERLAAALALDDIPVPYTPDRDASTENSWRAKYLTIPRETAD